MFLIIDFVRFYLHVDPDFSNLKTPFFELQYQARGELPELGRNRRIVSQNDQGSRIQVRDPACSGECLGSGFGQQRLQVLQPLRLPGEGPEASGSGEDIADLLDRHRGGLE